MLTAFCWALALIMLALGIYVAWWYIDLGRIQRAGDRYAKLYNGGQIAEPTAVASSEPAATATPEITTEPTPKVTNSSRNAVANPPHQSPSVTASPQGEAFPSRGRWPEGSDGVSNTPQVSLNNQVTSTPETAPKPTPEITATPEATIEPTPEVTSTPETTPKPTPVSTPEVTVEPSPAPTETPDGQPLNGPLSVPRAVPSPQATLVPMPAITAEPTPLITAKPTPEPTSLPTLIPMPTPSPVPFGADMPVADDVLIPTPGADTLVFALPTAPPVQESFDALLALNPETVGFLEIEDMLALPVAQRENDNDYYLSHTFEGAEAQEGALFLDGMNRLIPEDDCLIVYGHNMKNKTMFGKLNAYGDLRYLRSHSVIRFDTLYENRRYVAFAAFTASMKPDNARYFDVRHFIFDEAEFDKFVLKLQSRSLYKSPIDVRYGDRLLLLVTCDYTRTQGRFILALRQLRPDETEADVQALAMTTVAK